MTARNRWVLGALFGVQVLCWLFCGVCSCGDSGPKPGGPRPVAVAGEWAGIVPGWNGPVVEEADTTTARFVLDQQWDVVSGAFRVGRQSWVLKAGYVYGDSVSLTFLGRESGQIVYLAGRVSASMIHGTWRKVDLQDMQVYLRGSWHVRRM
jgi:hypothetical protein